MIIQRLLILMAFCLIVACNYDDYDSDNRIYKDEVFYTHKDSLLTGVIKNKPIESNFCFLQITVQSDNKSSIKALKKYLRKSLDFSSETKRSEKKYTLSFATKAFKNETEGILLSASDMIYLSYAFDVLPTSIKITPSSQEMEIKFSDKDLYKQAWLKTIEEDYFYSYHYLIKYIKKYPDDAKGYSLKASILKNVDLEILILKYLDKALEIDESDPNGLRSKAFLLAKLGDTLALTYINTFIDKHPENP